MSAVRNRPESGIASLNQGHDSVPPKVEKKGGEGISWIPQFMLSPAGRLYFLRLVIGSSTMMLGFAISVFVDNPKELSWILGLVLTIVTTLHHLATAMGPLIESAAWVDITFTFVELICFLVTSSFFVAKVDRVKKGSLGSVGIRFQTKLFLLAFVGAWLVSLSLLILLVLKLLYIASWKKLQEAQVEPGKKPLTRMYERVDIGQEPSTDSGPNAVSWWKYPVQALFGTTIWSENVPGESTVLAGLRGFLTAVSVCTLLAFGVYQAIIAPISELGMTPYKQIRAASLPQSFTSLNGGGWNIMVVRVQLMATSTRHDRPLPCSHRAAQVLDSCRVTNTTVTALQAAKNGPSQAVLVTCPPNTPLPDVALVVNFTGLVGNTRRWSWNVVSVYVGLTENVDNVFANTQPIFLFQGTHMVAVTDVQFRQQLKPAELGTLGFESMETFLISAVKQVMPVSLDLGPNISTLRFAPDDFTREFTVVQDYRSKTVLEGLSSVGGLGSFLSTILVLLLGTSLMRAILRSKPYSPFGLLHNLQCQQEAMAAKCKGKYQQLEPNMLQLNDPKGRGVVAFLFDTLVDMGALGYQEQELAHTHAKEGTLADGEPPYVRFV